MNRKRTKSTMDGSWNTFVAITKKRAKNLDIFSFIFQHGHSVTIGVLVNRAAHQLSMNTSSTNAQAFNLEELNRESDPRFIQRWRTAGYRFSRLDCEVSMVISVICRDCMNVSMRIIECISASMAGGTWERVTPSCACQYSRDYCERCEFSFLRQGSGMQISVTASLPEPKCSNSNYSSTGLFTDP